jgi:RNA polymerase sigma factor (sigma-70 family)
MPADGQVNQKSPGPQQSASDSIGGLLNELSSGRADAAWARFLERFSPLLLHVARQFAVDNERAADCYLFVCEQLSDNRFRRLLSFRRDGPAQFSTWLKTVSANLCIDWRRKQEGRIRAPTAIASLTSLEQHVYRLIYVQGATRNECLRVLEQKFPGLDIERISDINARLFARLSPRQRWQVTLRPRNPVSLDEPTAADESYVPSEPVDPCEGPDWLVDKDQTRLRLEKALSKLEPRKRLLIRLRYQQDLTLEEVARLVGFSDPYKAHREIQAALSDLALLLPAEKP